MVIIFDICFFDRDNRIDVICIWEEERVGIVDGLEVEIEELWLVNEVFSVLIFIGGGVEKGEI